MSTSRSLRNVLLKMRAPNTFVPAVMLHSGLVDRYAAAGSPIGEVFVAFNERGITAVRRAATARAFELNFAKDFGRRAVASEAIPANVARAVSGDERAIAKLAFNLDRLSEFQRAVLHKAQEIPRGQVRSYAWIAKAIGRPTAVRAVGTALAKNPVPLLIPCHRVVRSDGTIGDYALGSPNKRRILQYEGALS